MTMAIRRSLMDGNLTDVGVGRSEAVFVGQRSLGGGLPQLP